MLYVYTNVCLLLSNKKMAAEINSICYANKILKDCIFFLQTSKAEEITPSIWSTVIEGKKAIPICYFI